VLFSLLISFSAYLWGIETGFGRWGRSKFLCSQPTYEELKLTFTAITCDRGTGSQPTYEELKLAMTKRAAAVIVVLSLPMRNWNGFWCRCLCQNRSVLSLPMRNWNPTVPGFFARRSFVLSLPMRNWNLPPSHRLHLFHQTVLSLPMRNWNVLATQTNFTLQRVLSLPMRNWNPPCLWRGSREGKFSAYLWGIETHLGAEAPHRRHGVLSLPMRNWNTSKRQVENTSSAFSAYLWGIETIYNTRIHHNNNQFSAYLWGIETCNGREQLQPPYSRSQPTYEELKLVEADEGSSKIFRFSAYLWGIETFAASRTLFIPLAFSAYLWGIETLYGLAIKYIVASSQPTYEELKQISVQVVGGSANGFSAYLWGIETPGGAAWSGLPLRSQPTYEELKHEAQLDGEIPLDVLSLPMRNWNQRFRDPCGRPCRVLSLPMRNWNIGTP